MAGRCNSIRKGTINAFGTLQAPATSYHLKIQGLARIEQALRFCTKRACGRICAKSGSGIQNEEQRAREIAVLLARLRHRDQGTAGG